MTALLGLLALSMFIATILGKASISLPEMARMLLNRLAVFDFEPTWRAVDETILFQIRLPRVIGGAVVGGALATAGVLFQGLFRNSMADPLFVREFV